jgi:hypothetical protein
VCLEWEISLETPLEDSWTDSRLRELVLIWLKKESLDSRARAQREDSLVTLRAVSRFNMLLLIKYQL